MPETTPGYDAALAAAEHHAAMLKRHDPFYITQLANQLEQAVEFRIPCPGHPHHADLRIKRRLDGQADGWAVLNDNPGNEHAWTGTRWIYRGNLTREQIYRYTRDDAIEEATRIAPLETAAFLAHIERLRAQHQEGVTQ
ncbi:hypothetical protein [Streptomyces sp. NBRC 110035]|uniref:hypothetical protein n=1 Tax=Streptomyces sp. NBRC 110035 TaxID=1547867 RepID=UPI0005A87929|nr:hypothetical protein [Streptomyces sp. NBRC 110035]